MLARLGSPATWVRPAWEFIRGGPAMPPLVPEKRPSSQLPVESQVRAAIAQGLGFMVLTFAMAVAVSAAATSPRQEEIWLQWVAAWRMLESEPHHWNPLGVEGLLVAVTVPLFLATQVGRVVSRHPRSSVAAQMIALDWLTTATCSASAVVSWLFLPQRLPPVRGW